MIYLFFIFSSSDNASKPYFYNYFTFIDTQNEIWVSSIQKDSNTHSPTQERNVAQINYNLFDFIIGKLIRML